jgi:two-component system, NarL family, sensor histidine kinase DevS
VIETKNTPAFLLGSLFLFSLLALLITVQLASAHLRWSLVFETGDTVASEMLSLTIDALDLIEEPGEIDSREELTRFFQRQDMLTSILAEDQIRLTRGDQVSIITVQDPDWLHLPALFWIQVIVGMGALVISGWIWSLRSRDLAAQLFMLSGVATLLFTFAAAIYTTRELALPAGLFRILRSINEFGASLFGIAILSLFLVYPIRLPSWRFMMGTQAMFFSIWTLLSILDILPLWANVNLITLCEMIGICLALAAQFIATRGQPAARASLSWLGLSVLAGAGGFIVLIALPLVLGNDAAISQGYAFLLFLLIYLGLAAGITRYRLFDVGQWAFRFLFYSLGALLLVLLDAALIALIGLQRLPALGLAMFIVGFLYLPLRDLTGRRLLGSKSLAPHELVDAAMHVALVPDAGERANRWRLLIHRLFDPLELSVVAEGVGQVSLQDDGTSLLIPAVAGAPALQVRHAQAGKQLFSQQSARLVEQLVSLIEQVEASRVSYDRGVREERMRIAQDLHDDVGARLLTGLHTGEAMMRSCIEGALADMRAIVKGIAGESVCLTDLLADLRAESQGRLEAAGMMLVWPMDSYDNSELMIDYRYYKALGSLLREAVSNAIKHSKASTMSVQISLTPGQINLDIRDDGVGFPPVTADNKGFGLQSIRKRVADLGGSCRFSETGTAVHLQVVMPIRSS